VRRQILNARTFKRVTLLDKEKPNYKKNVLTLNITYHPAYAQVKKILSNIHLLLTPDSEHLKAFSKVPIVRFKRGRSLKDILVRAKLPEPQPSGNGSSDRCGSKRCGVCNYIKETSTFNDSSGEKVYTIRPKNLNCNSECVVYLVQCKKCSMQYIGSTSTPFRQRFNNYKSCHKKHNLGVPIIQESFHAHFNQEGHRGIDDWQFILIDQADSLFSVRRKESFWQHRLNTFAPAGLNEREVSVI